MSSLKIPYGLERQSKDILELSEGISPAINIRMGPWVPIVEYNRRSEFGIAIKAGSVLAIEYISTAVGLIQPGHYYVPANGGVATTLAYTILDLGITLNKNTGAAVTQAEIDASSTATHPANNPVGYNFFDFYHDQEQLHNNMQIQTQEKAVVRDYFMEVPVKYAYQLGAPGEKVIADWAVPGAWRVLDSTFYTGAGRLTAADGVIAVAEHLIMQNQQIGRIWSVEAVSDIDNLTQELPMPGLGLTGRDSSGIPPHLRNAATLSAATWRAKIMINS